MCGHCREMNQRLYPLKSFSERPQGKSTDAFPNGGGVAGRKSTRVPTALYLSFVAFRGIVVAWSSL